MIARLALLAVALILLAGCGQKGPLYLPGDTEAAERYGPRPAPEGTADDAPDDAGPSDEGADNESPDDES